MNYVPVKNKIIKNIHKKYENIEEISLEEWLEYDECKCGGPLFKYHDTTCNVYVVKCGHVKESLDIKTRLWFPSKKQPCNFINICRGDEQPDYSDYSAPVRKKVEKINPHTFLAEKLDSLFKFYFLTKKDITIQEINSIVKFKLNRKIRYVYYLVTAGPILKESHREPMEEYYSRIFSRPIKDVNCLIQKKIKTPLIPSELSDSESEDVESASENDETGSEYSVSEKSDTEVATECQITEELLDDLDNLELYDEPDEPEEYDYND